MFVQLAINLPSVQGTYHYHLPPELEGRVQTGHLVTAPFGAQTVQGLVIGFVERADVPETRPIRALVDPEPVITPEQLKLAEWLRDQTLSPLIDAITLMLPPGLSQQADGVYTLVSPDHSPKSAVQKRLQELLQRRGPLRGRQIQRALPRVNWRRSAEALVRAGVLERKSILDPPKVGPRRIRTVRLAVAPSAARAVFDDLGDPARKAAARRRAILEFLIQEREPVDIGWIYAETGGTRADLTQLESRGLIGLGEAEVWRDPLEEFEFIPSHAPPLTQEQSLAWSQIQPALGVRAPQRPTTYLLHGVTGSGKTEIYLRAVEEILAGGRRAIILVPEIALTPQTVRRFLARFPGEVGLLHSQLTKGERYDTWRRARAGLLNVVVGPRSALFAPFSRIGLIVVDESHDESYKEQARQPRYHAREAAIAYGSILGATCILGTATPDLVTNYRAEGGALHRLQLPQRILAHRERVDRQASRLGISSQYRPLQGDAQTIDLPPVRIVDMRQELRAGVRSLFSRPLQKALHESLAAGQQCILFLNRRGTATYVFCRDCGWVARCPRCDSPLTQHEAEGKLRCHHCGYLRGSTSTCPECKSQRVRHFGAGTQRIEAEVARMFPDARTIRWDHDTAHTRGSHEVILAHFAAHRADVLIGTQMVAKGLDLPLVTLVGVVSADTGLNLPDYRSAERTFQILTQVAGRAGRGLLGGRVILQTYHPDHYAIQAAARHDYESFYAQELAHRRRLGYPPFQRLVRLIYQHVNAQAAETEAHRLAKVLERKLAAQGDSSALIGPAPAYYQRLRGMFRWQIILRGADPRAYISAEIPDGWSVDVDPVSLL